MAKERRLTPGELKRKESFEVRAQELTQQGYVKKDLTISVVRANVLTLIMAIPVVVLFYLLYYTVHQQHIALNLDFRKSILILFAMLALTVVHEFVHGITWALFTKERFGAIEFGVMWDSLTPYCTCKVELTKMQYAIGAVMPTIVVGILPAMIALIGNYPLVFATSLLMVICGGGDMLILIKLLFHKENGKESIYVDHPYECGIVVFERAA